MSEENSSNDKNRRIVLPPGKYFLIGKDGDREITDYYSLTNKERWLLGLPQLEIEVDQLGGENDVQRDS